ncbi:MAG: hypothetical protein FJZ47_00225 [Candidatus Tectomicrobia bacterium]|uniref:Uncharacterized protein n=1 Tax=Tectimicrobiota bacterium TaxID=2528274 RepID=A0A937VYX5_UNCTE|nr:hypothetical protein [Candidatus Tectomicrobia bacterium]
MPKEWTHTREVLFKMQPLTAGLYIGKLAFKSPQIFAQARTLLQQYPLHDDRFKIQMIHYLRETFPGEMESLYEALLKDIMADKLQLEA